MAKLLLFSLLLLYSLTGHANCNQQCALDKITKEGWLKRAKKEKLNVFSYPKMLRSGDIIEVGPFKENQPSTLLDDSWLFFVDLHPGALFSHPTIFIRISQVTGEVITTRENGYPVLNGLSLFSSPEDIKVQAYQPKGYPRVQPLRNISFPNIGPIRILPAPIIMNQMMKGLIPEDPTPVNIGILPDNQIDWKKYPKEKDEEDLEYKERVRGLTEKAQPAETFAHEANKCGCANGGGKKLGLFLQGLANPHQAVGDKGIEAYLYKSGYDTISRKPHYPGTNLEKGMVTTKANVIKAFDELASKVSDCCDEVVIIISGHGSERGAINMNVFEERPNPSRPGEKVQEGSRLGFHMTTKFLREQLNKIKSCNVKVILSSCHSGKHLENGLNLIEKDAIAGCMCRTVMATSSARQVSYLGDSERILNAWKKNSGDLVKGLNEFRALMKSNSDKHFLDNQTPMIQSTDCILCKDEDGDGIRTGLEILEGTDYLNPDSDNDGLDDMLEKEWQTDPNNPDSDGDGLTDGVEVFELGILPNNPDSDGDGVDDQNEIRGMTDPQNPDTDGDGVNDGQEYKDGTSPTNPEDYRRKKSE